MNKKYLVLSFVLVLLLTACGAQTLQVTASETPQPCPAWFDKAVPCELMIQKMPVSEKSDSSTGSEDFDMEEYAAVRIIIIGGEMLLNEASGIRVEKDNGELFVPETDRMLAGTYIVFVTENESGIHSFTLQNSGSTNVALSLEFVKISEDKTP